MHTKLSHKLNGKAKVMWFLKEVSPKLCVLAQCFVNPVLALGLQVYHLVTVCVASQRGLFVTFLLWSSWTLKVALPSGHVDD